MRKIWAAYGESSGCTIANDWTLQNLSKRIVNAEGEEREELCKALEERLATAKVYTEGGWRDKWPTGFCSPDIIPRYRWDYMGISAGELAEKIANREITIDDLAVETITIDLQADAPQIGHEYYISCVRESSIIWKLVLHKWNLKFYSTGRKTSF